MRGLFVETMVQKKRGVFRLSQALVELDLFRRATCRPSAQLCQAVDQINRRLGRGKVFTVSGISAPDDARDMLLIHLVDDLPRCAEMDLIQTGVCQKSDRENRNMLVQRMSAGFVL